MRLDRAEVSGSISPDGAGNGPIPSPGCTVTARERSLPPPNCCSPTSIRTTNRQVAALFDKVIHAGEPFSSKHRIIDTDGRIHHVIVVGDRMLDEHDRAVGTSGYYIDVTETLETDLRVFNTALTEAVAELEQSRAVIEQAKGALMLVYGISSERAFGILTWRSQQTNTKLRTLAGSFVDALTAETTLPASFRARFDHLLLTAHEHPDTRPGTRDRQAGPTR